jgi:putative NADH-flavin reductase
MKVGIIGAGAVGSACVTALVARGCAREIVVVNRNRNRAKGLVTDVQYGAVLAADIEIRDGDYTDLEGASVVMITAGANEKTGGATDRNDPAGRLRLLETNAKAMILGALDKAGGEEYLMRQANENPSAFMTLLGKGSNPISSQLRQVVVQMRAACRRRKYRGRRPPPLI